MATRALPFASLALAALAACTPGFQAPSDVIDLRVLAVSAEPPEAFADLDAGTVAPVTVTVLTADPNTGRGPVTATGTICFPTDDLVCVDPQIQLASQTRPTPGELTFQIAAPSDLVVGALQDDKLKGLGGVRVQFTTSVTDGDPAGATAAEKVLLYSTTPPAQANHSPHIGSVEVSRDSSTKQQLLPGGTLQLSAGVQVGLRPLVGAGSDGAETYTTTDLTGNTVTLTEQLAYAFFTTPGCEFDEDTASEPLPGTPTPPLGIVRFVCGVSGGAGGTLWMVVRDGRGGVSWVSFPWSSQ